MKTRSRKRAREASISQDQPTTDSQAKASPQKDDGDGKQDAPGTTNSRPPRKKTRPPLRGSTPSSESNRAPPASPRPSTPNRDSPPRSGDADADKPESPAAREPSARTTRPQNKFRRPAIDVGLDWQAARREREQAEAAKTEKQIQDARKKAEKEENAHRRRAGIQRLAALENERERRDHEEDEQLAGTGTARVGNRASGKASATQPASTGAAEGTDGTGSEFSGDDESASDGSEQEEGEEEEGSEGEDLRKPVRRRKRKTKAELRHERQVKVLGEISSAREEVARGKKPASGHAEKRQPEDAGATEKGPRSAPAKPPSIIPHTSLTGNDSGDAFRPGYKAKLLAGQAASRSRSSTAPTSRHSSTPAKSSATSPSKSTSGSRIRPAGTKPAPAAQNARFETPLPSEGEDEDETLGGLTDDHVAIGRNFVNRGSSGTPSQSVKVTFVQPERQPKAKAKRTRKVDMNPKQSLSADQLDDWIRPTFETILVPTLLDHYGSEEDFWTLDEKTALKRGKGAPSSASPNDPERRDLVGIMQEIIDSLYPREFTKLQQTDLLVRVVRQRILNWCRGFYERAMKVVKAGFEDYKAKTPDATKADIKKWVAAALDPDTGHAFWEKPPSRQDPAAHGNFQSVYFLSVFAPHLNLTANSHYEERRPPIGAFSLALAAIDFTFSAYETGEYVAPQKKFDQPGVGHISDWYLKDAVRPALQKSNLWSTVMKRAGEFNGPIAPSTSAEGLAPSRRRRARRVLDSSPPRPTDSE